MASQSISIDIPVLPHVKNLLLTLYGPEPIKAHVNNLPGSDLRFIYLEMTHNSPDKIHGEKITMAISHRLAPYYYKFCHAFSLGCYFEKQFTMLLFGHIEAQKNCGIATTEAIKNFFIQYN